MKLLAISEHYFPRLGGTVNYLHETLSALARQGVRVELWVPGPRPPNWLPDDLAAPPYAVVWIDADYPARGDPSRAARYAFCQAVNRRALARAGSGESPDVLHLVFGLFLMEVLDTHALRRAGLPSVVTVHNVPPHECRLVAADAPWHARLKEEARLRLVGWKNRARLRAHPWDAVVVPSEQVRVLLAAVLPEQAIAVIGHGPTSALAALMNPPASRRPGGGPVRLLTVGGYAPHKRQHLIPKVAARLRDRGLAFEWDVVGPAGRIAGYFDGVRAAVADAGLGDRVRIRDAVPLAELATLYDRAHLYVQPSVEEGFCITALDAAAVGLPVIASPAGALVRIAEASGGTVADSAPAPLAHAIEAFVTGQCWGDAAAQMAVVRAAFSWEAAAQALRARYTALLARNPADA